MRKDEVQISFLPIPKPYKT